MLELKNISKTYKKKVVALDNINLKFLNTGLVFIKGDSGSGKSTLLNIISTLELPSEGEVLYNGLCLDKKTSANYLKNDISFIFQDANLFENLSVIENLSIYSDLSEVTDLLNRLDIESIRTKKVKNLSGGEKRRVAIARAILKHPRILLCDEPEASLDEENRENIFNILKYLSKDMLVIVSSHDSDVDEYANRIIVLEQGHVKDDKIINEIQDSKTIKNKTYNVNKKFLSIVSKDILFSKKVSFIVTAIILAVFSFLILFAGFSSEFDYPSILTKTMKHEGSHMLISKDKVDPLYVFKNNSHTRPDGTTYSYGGDYLRLNLKELPTNYNSSNNLFYNPPSYGHFIIFDENYVMTDLVGNKPNSANEIVIYEILAEIIMHQGIYLSNGELMNPKDINELIGLEVMMGELPVKITGVIRQDLTNYNVFRDSNYYSIEDVNFIKNIRALSFESLIGIFKEIILVHDDFFEFIEGHYELKIDAMEESLFFLDDYKDIHDYLKEVNPKNKTDINLYESLMQGSGFGDLELIGNAYAYSTSILYYFFLFGQIIFLLSPFLLVIMVYVIMMYFENVYKKNREKFAILSCLGLTNKDMNKVYFNALLKFFAGVMLISIVLLTSVITYLNINLSNLVGFYLHPFSFNKTYLLLSVLILCITFALTYLFLKFRVKKRDAIMVLKNN